MYEIEHVKNLKLIKFLLSYIFIHVRCYQQWRIQVGRNSPPLILIDYMFGPGGGALTPHFGMYVTQQSEKWGGGGGSGASSSVKMGVSGTVFVGIRGLLN